MTLHVIATARACRSHTAVIALRQMDGQPSSFADKRTRLCEDGSTSHGGVLTTSRGTSLSCILPHHAFVDNEHR
jgi:hypothetical protein